MIGSDWVFVGPRRWWQPSSRQRKQDRFVAYKPHRGVVWEWRPAGDAGTAPYVIEIMRPFDEDMPMLGRSVLGDRVLLRGLLPERDVGIRSRRLSRAEHALAMEKTQVFLVEPEIKTPSQVSDFARRLILRAQSAAIESGTWPFTCALAAAKLQGTDSDRAERN